LGIKDHQDEIGRFSNGDDLSTATFAVRSSLDDTWQIEELQLGAFDE